MKKTGTNIIVRIIFISVILLPQACFDTEPLTDENGNELSFVFASGPKNENYYSFAEGMIDAASQSLGVFMNNQSTAGSLENAVKLARGNAYMGLVQEDIFRFCRDRFKVQYASNPSTAEKRYLEVASRLKIIMAAYNEDVFLLVKTGITGISDLSAKNVNIGPIDSGTYITANSVLDANGITCTRTTFDNAEAVQKILNGDADCDAAFIVSVSPNRILKEIPSTAGVRLIRVTMPAGKKFYDETGVINAGDYPFQNAPISGNMRVKTLLAVGKNFNDRAVDLFIRHVFDKSQEYASYNSKWKDVNLSLSFDYIRRNPQLIDYRAFCSIASTPEINSENLKPGFYSGEAGSSYSSLAGELIWLMSSNMEIDLKEQQSTGSRENAIRMADGNASLAIVQDDMFDFFESSNLMLDSLKVASMKKIVPLHYEYLHLLRNTTTGPSDVADFPNRRINLGPKTSGTFITAISVIKSYGFSESDNIIYTFDSPSDSVLNVNNGSSDAAFVMSGLPYYRFYSHDTWDVTSELNASNLIGCAFNGTIPYPYSLDGTGVISGNGTAAYQNYPYPAEACDTASISTIRVRAMLVASPAFDDSNITTFIKSIFRKSYYMTNPPDQDQWPSKGLGGDYEPDQVWMSIRKTSIKSILDLDNYDTDVDSLDDRGVYDTIIGAKEYFLNHPFGWSEESAEYYLSMFPDN